MPTILGHRHYIFHPGYNNPGGFDKGYDFVFSDDLEVWIGRKKKEKRYQDNLKYKPRTPKNPI